MPDTSAKLKKDSFFISITKWKKDGIKQLSMRKAVNLSQLIENFLTDHFGEELETFRPLKEKERS
ncbi:chaperone required for assembly of F1-ATPase [Catalinimonas alkaloidigena]|uniref:hypothetical protein n=1 Tax=Catalinimonas alkaloidigena TaxID=1075417 RepID=UPI0024077055|nr:hypothetical protein [Catalinimonas alkaloidigena]MDF9799739.1 chaperone required for assembly of F1-ATPase [Catalinimonas alkaloidigena]